MITTEPMASLTEEKIAHLMVGRDIKTERYPSSEKAGEVKLEVKDLRYTDADGVEVLKGINLEIRA